MVARRAADGSMRDAMSLTDQAIAFGEGKVLAADVRAMLGTLDHGQVYGVLQALLEGDARALLEAVRHLAEQGPDWGGVLAEILNVLHRVAIAQALPEAIDNGQGDRERVLALAQALPAEDVQFYYQMGLIGRRDLPLAPIRVALRDGVAADARVPPGGRRRRAEDAAKGPGDPARPRLIPPTPRGRRGLACAGRCRCSRACRGCARRSPGCPAGSAIRRRRRSSARRGSGCRRARRRGRGRRLALGRAGAEPRCRARARGPRPEARARGPSPSPSPSR